MPDDKRFRIITPVHDDWASASSLVRDLDRVVARMDGTVDILMVDDGSREIPADFAAVFDSLRHLRNITILRLVTNQGHQRAIACGLVHTFEQRRYDAVIVMDCDGEDKPEDVAALMERMQADAVPVVVAQRRQRSEVAAFRFFYILYKLLFRLLVGRRIDFGNFCAISMPMLERLVYSPGLWNHMAATIMLLFPNPPRLPTARGRRYAGQSSMNGVSLIIHAISAISVFDAIVVTRILLASFVGALVFTAAIVAAIVLRFSTNLAIPGWTTYVVFSLTVLLFQVLIMASGACFLLMASRANPPILPVVTARPLFRAEIAIRGAQV